MRSLDFRGCALAVHEAGSGPPMVFLHNGGADHQLWGAQRDHFSARYRTISPDLPGFGASEPAGPALSLDLLVDVIAAVTDGGPPAVLVGNCMGAGAALAFAARRPERVAGLVLSNLATGASLRAGPMRALIALDRLLPDASGLMRLVHHLPGVQRQIRRKQYGPPPDEEHPLWTRYLEMSAQPAQFDARVTLLRGIPSFDALDDLPPPPVSLCLLWGAENRVVPPSQGRHLRDRLAPARYSEIERAGHMVMAERPDAVIAEMEGFLTAT